MSIIGPIPEHWVIIWEFENSIIDKRFSISYKPLVMDSRISSGGGGGGGGCTCQVGLVVNDIK